MAPGSLAGRGEGFVVYRRLQLMILLRTKKKKKKPKRSFPGCDVEKSIAGPELFVCLQTKRAIRSAACSHCFPWLSHCFPWLCHCPGTPRTPGGFWNQSWPGECGINAPLHQPADPGAAPRCSRTCEESITSLCYCTGGRL